MAGLAPQQTGVGTTAVLFPGQGSQTPWMRPIVERSRPDLLELATAEVGIDPFEHVAEGTRFTQPAIYCASLAGWSTLGELEADYLAGHSLGEFAALVAAGALGAEDGLRLVILRGRLMQQAAEASGDGAMLAISGGQDIAAAIARQLELTVANENAPDQTVLSGRSDAIDAAASEAKARGLRAKRLAVAGAFHSSAMEQIVPEFEAALSAVDFAPPQTPVYSSLTAKPFKDPRRELAAGLTNPVHWRSTLAALHSLGVRRFVEAGPGKVLTGLVRRNLSEVEAHTAEELVVASV